MGIIPLQYLEGQTAESLGLTGKEKYCIELPQDLKPGQKATVKVGIIIIILGLYRHATLPRFRGIPHFFFFFLRETFVFLLFF